MKLENVETVAVLGAGNMGHGIAEVAALAGYEVTMRDIKEEFVQNGYEQIEWSLDKLAEKDRISDEEAEAALDRVTPHVDIEAAVGDADFVIEAVPEKMDIKKDVYGEVIEHLPEEAIITTNTSSLSITELSEVTDRPARFCGMHFFNPPVRMQLVEVISGGHTDESTLEVAEGLAEAFGKTPVRVRKDSPGFIVNRVLVPLMNEACWIVSEGAGTITEVDSTTKFDMGLPMGAFELGDQVGNDVTYHVLEYMHEELGEAYEPAPLLEEVVEEERFGKKSGEGFYDYESGDGVEIPPDAGNDELRNRLTAVMANEVGNLVGNDVSDPDAIDKAMALGAGFPDGPAKMADGVGLEALVETLESLEAETEHPRFVVSDGLRAAAGDGGFYDEDDDGETSYDTIELTYPEEYDDVAHLVIDREARMNTVSVEMLDELDDAIETLSEDDEVRALLLSGRGDRAFSAGADITSMAAGTTPVEGRKLSRKGQEVFGALESAPMPVVAAIDGFALGGGMELATCADLRVASERSTLGQPEVNLGLLPGWGGTQRLQHIVGEGRAKEIILTGERYDAATLADYGFLNEVVESEELEARALELTADLAAGPPIAQEYIKRAMLRGWEDTEAGLEIEAQAFGQVLGTEDLSEGLAAFENDREPEFEGR
ncbi:MAG: 3-hydroxyacyl-CoA dehydrogenase NAD-binding domain-containing protein [Natronomonas sp.]